MTVVGETELHDDAGHDVPRNIIAGDARGDAATALAAAADARRPDSAAEAELAAAGADGTGPGEQDMPDIEFMPAPDSHDALGPFTMTAPRAASAGAGRSMNKATVRAVHDKRAREKAPAPHDVQLDAAMKPGKRARRAATESGTYGGEFPARRRDDTVAGSEAAACAQENP